MSDLPPLTADDVARRSLDDLIELLIELEDRAPRLLIDECARRGDDFLERAWEILQHGPGWEDDATQGEWWLPTHVVMTLGLMTEPRAAELLIAYLEKLAAQGDDSQESWTAEYWAAYFANKPDAVIDAVRALVEDDATDWYVRINAQEAVLDRALQHGRIETELDWLVAIAEDAAVDMEVRLHSAARLLDFPRERCRPLLYRLALKQTTMEPVFDTAAVEAAYARNTDAPEWAERADPWVFYTPEEMAVRQDRWAEESDDGDEAVVDPYVREAPKVGRNDPCPCGSGKKYKRCCGAD